MKIAFLIQRTELYNSIRTIVQAAENADCDIVFIPIPRHIIGKGIFDTTNFSKVMDFCNSLHIGRVIPGYDDVTEQYLDLSGYLFDYIFLSVPYIEQYPHAFSFDRLSKCGKLCYVSYGYTLLKKHLPHIYQSKIFAEHISYIFASNRLEYEFGQKYLRPTAWIGQKILFNVGFPRFDLVDKKSNKGDTILWIPRFTVKWGWQTNNEQSSFMLFYQSFLRFAEKYPDYRFVIRPHPLMFDNFLARGIMSQDEIDSFKSHIQQSINITSEIRYPKGYCCCMWRTESPKKH